LSAMTVRNWPSWLLPFAIALALRLWGLGEIPTSLTNDEARLGYRAWHVARSVGPRGQSCPPPEYDPAACQQTSPSADDIGPVSLGTFAVAASVWLFEPSPFAVRLPFAVAGAVAVVPVGVIGEAIFGTRVAGAAASLLLATSPWHLAFTRVAREGAWLVLGLLVMVAGLVGAGAWAGRVGRLVPTGLAVVGAAITTQGDSIGAIAVATTAIAVGIALAIQTSVGEAGELVGPRASLPDQPVTRTAAHSRPADDPGRNGALGSDGVGLHPGGFSAKAVRAPSPIPAPVRASGAKLLARVAPALITVAVMTLPPFAATGAFSLGPDQQTSAEAEAKSAKRLSEDSSGITGMLQAPWAILGRAGLHAYATHFDLTFLFTRGDSDRRNHPTGFGQLSLIDLPLVVGGAVLALQSGWSRRSGNDRTARWFVVVAWLAVSPLPAAFAVSGADAARSIGMVPALALLEAGAVAAMWPRVVARGVTFEARLVVGVSAVAWAVATSLHDPVDAGLALGSGAFSGYEWARVQLDSGRAAQVVVVGDASKSLEAALLALRFDPLARVPRSTAEAHSAGERVAVCEEFDWASERRDPSAASRLYAIVSGARAPDGFNVAHVAFTGDGRPVVQFVRVSA
jgi:hypothetical protein